MSVDESFGIIYKENVENNTLVDAQHLFRNAGNEV